jgi:hypothetical protein
MTAGSAKQSRELQCCARKKGYFDMTYVPDTQGSEEVRLPPDISQQNEISPLTQ